MLSLLPNNFDLQAAGAKYPVKREDSLNSVLQQELLRYAFNIP